MTYYMRHRCVYYVHEFADDARTVLKHERVYKSFRDLKADKKYASVFPTGRSLQKFIDTHCRCPKSMKRRETISPRTPAGTDPERRRRIYVQRLKVFYPVKVAKKESKDDSNDESKDESKDECER